MHETGNRSVQLVARNHEARTEVKSFMHQNARYEGIANYVPWLNHSSFRTRGEIIRASRCTLRENQWIAYRGWIIRATCCTKWITLLTVDNMLFEKTHAKITALYFVPFVIRSCNKLHATRKSWIAHRGWIFRASRCTLRGNHKSPIEVESFMQQVARYARNRKCPKRLNNVPCVVHSCIEMHATRESVNRVPRLIHSCNKLHATGESYNALPLHYE